jgi:hypothetical protein
MNLLGIDLDGSALLGHPVPCFQAPRWPFWSSRYQSRLTTDRCILVGDAAGLVDPLYGEGIRHALQSARLAADAISEGDLKGYEKAVWRHIGHPLAVAGKVAELFYRWPRLGYRLVLSNPRGVAEFVRLLAGQATYHGIGRRLLTPSLLRLGPVIGRRNQRQAGPVSLGRHHVGSDATTIG